MIRIEFTPEMIAELNYERYHHPHPLVQQRMEVLYLKSQGLKHQDIRSICHISKTTLVSYLDKYIDGGVERLKQLEYRGQPSELNVHAATLEEYFREHPPKTVSEARAAITAVTKIERSPTQVQAFLKRLGLKRRKVGFVPGKSGTPEKIVEQETFQQKQLEPVLELAKQGKQAVFLSMLLILSIAHF